MYIGNMPTYIYIHAYIMHIVYLHIYVSYTYAVSKVSFSPICSSEWLSGEIFLNYVMICHTSFCHGYFRMKSNIYSYFSNFIYTCNLFSNVSIGLLLWLIEWLSVQLETSRVRVLEDVSAEIEDTVMASLSKVHMDDDIIVLTLTWM